MIEMYKYYCVTNDTAYVWRNVFTAYPWFYFSIIKEADVDEVERSE